MEINRLFRRHLLALRPYSTARDENRSRHGIFLDANENPYDWPQSRYPDPFQMDLKHEISRLKGLDVSNIFLGNGTDEAIDIVIRIFCEPGIDEVIILPPTYGMYEVSCHTHAVKVLEVPLDAFFQPDVEAILALGQHAKLLFICSPNNPTGNGIDVIKVERLLNNFSGIVVIDEAYIDFAEGIGFQHLLSQFPKLIILQTFSKAWAMAGARIGVAMANHLIIEMMNKVKLPYNLNNLSAMALMQQLNNKQRIMAEIAAIKKQREFLTYSLKKLPFVRKVFPSEANFILIKVDEAQAVYHYLLKNGIVIRNRSNLVGLTNCIRISIGAEKDNELLISLLRKY